MLGGLEDADLADEVDLLDADDADLLESDLPVVDLFDDAATDLFDSDLLDSTDLALVDLADVVDLAVVDLATSDPPGRPAMAPTDGLDEALTLMSTARMRRTSALPCCSQ